MKNALILLVAFLVCSTAKSQDFLHKLPIKNAKLGKVSSAKISLVFDADPSTLKGPVSKNFKVWNKQSAALKIRTRKVINNPKGLAAKNRKVWEESESPNVSSKAAYQLPKSMRPKKVWWH